MTDQRHSTDGAGTAEKQDEVRIRRACVAAFVVGFGTALAFFVLFPGLPHVVDLGALLTSFLVGGLAQWGCRVLMVRRVGGRG
ncbi:hypothetical protein ACIQU5_05335 [Streptomyces sp. NPDC090306]|uniref:hypothetical protein n=1 Tax=Streptomyces sp. NPDC090306 TaxID=3365961 RepID=UPI00382A39DE